MIGIIAAIIAFKKGHKTFAGWMGAWAALAIILLIAGYPQLSVGPGALFLIIAINMKKIEPSKAEVKVGGTLTKPTKEPVKESTTITPAPETNAKGSTPTVKNALPPSMVWVCPDCGERNEKEICQSCGRVHRGNEKVEPRLPDPEDAQVTVPEKTPASEKAQVLDEEIKTTSKDEAEKKRSEIFYFDSDGNITTKEKAVRAIIKEYDESGNVVKEIFGRITPQEKSASSFEEAVEEIRMGLTGDPEKDREYLSQQIRRYQDHPDHHEITKECGRLLFATLSDSEKDDWEAAMHADDHFRNTAETNKPLLILKRRKNGERIDLDKPVTIMGKDSDADIQLDSPKADEVNAVILLKSNMWFVANDFCSRALTVNGKRVQPGERRQLNKGDVIYIAEVETFDVIECVNGAPIEQFGTPVSGFTGFIGDGNPFSLKNVAAKIEDYLESGQLAHAKMLGDTVINSVMTQKEEKIDGHLCFNSPIEIVVHKAVHQDEEFRPLTDDDYTAFLLAYAKSLICSATDTSSDYKSLFEKATEYLKITAELSPENADVWEHLSYMALAEGDKDSSLQCLKMSLAFAYRKTGPCSLANAYRALSYYYYRDNKIISAAALYSAMKACGMEDHELLDKLHSKGVHDIPLKNYKQILNDNNLLTGFGPYVEAAALYLSDPSQNIPLDAETKELVREIKSTMP